jgi:hypothetical protein
MKTPTCSFESFDKIELHALADGLHSSDPDAVEWCITFMEAETSGVWHGRARAMMARRLKHCQLSAKQRSRVVRAVLDRLASGRFSEQFKDQLRLVLQLRPTAAYKVARECQAGAPPHVRRYCAWVLSHEAQG